MTKIYGHFYGDRWNEILPVLANGEVRSPDTKFYQNKDGRFDHLIALWTNAGYDKSNSVEWINFYPTIHYDNSVTTDFEQYCGHKHIRSWISKICPGKSAPFHQDIDDNLDEYVAQGELIRYSCFISKPNPGALFILDEKVFHKEPQGNVWQWGHYLDWHAGTNCGFYDKFMYHYIGLKI
jgi:hypothetical protein